MKINYFLYIAPLFTLFLFSCEKEIEFNGDKVKAKLVLNSILTPDAKVKIHLTESRFFLDSEKNFKEVNYATVKLWKDSINFETLSSSGNGYYKGTYTPKEGDSLRITAFAHGFDPIECSTEIVRPSPIISVDMMNVRENTQYYGNGNANIDSSYYDWSIKFDMDITFEDPKDIANYYALNLYLTLYFSNGKSDKHVVRFNSDDVVFQQTGNEVNIFEDSNELKSNLFNDKLFDGKKYKLKVKVENPMHITVGRQLQNPKDENPKIVGKEISVELQSLSLSYYKFRKTFKAGSDSDLEDIMNYFTEPVQVYSNVKGGVGILGSYSGSVYNVPLK